MSITLDFSRDGRYGHIFLRATRDGEVVRSDHFNILQHDPRVGFVRALLDADPTIDPVAIGERIQEIVAEVAGGKPVELPTITCRELATGNYTIDYIIDGVLVPRQPAIIGGPHKALKTSIAWDLAVSLQTGEPFLGRFEARQYCRVAFFSGEGGYGFLQDVGNRVCASKQVQLAELDGMVVCDRLPRLDRACDLDALGEALAKHDVNVAFFDPCYLALGGADAGNVLSMGERLGAVNEACAKTQTTPVFLHHLKRGRQDPHAPADLGDLSWSGFAEFAGQWLLLSRREPYVPSPTALHKLWLVCGGRAGHSSLHALDVEEGVTGSDVGRYWHAKTFEPDEVEQQKEDAASMKREAKAASQIERDVMAVCRALAKWPEGETATIVRTAAGLSGTRFSAAIASLIQSGDVVHCDMCKPNRKSPYTAYKLVSDDTP